jgi:hypothetical protein
VGLDILALARSIAETIIQDEKTKPICITERSATISSPFCRYFYQAYQELRGNQAPLLEDLVVQSVNMSFPGAMEKEFLSVIQNLNDRGYEPDSYITFSEHVFTIINNVSA